MSNEYQKYEPEFSEEDAKRFAKRSVRKKQKERFLRKKRKKKKTLKTFLKILIFFALILIGYKFVTLKGWYLNQNAFKEPNEDIVQIVNNHIVSTDIIQDSISLDSCLRIIMYIILLLIACIYNEFLVVNICGLSKDTKLFLDYKEKEDLLLTEMIDEDSNQDDTESKKAKKEFEINRDSIN